MTEKSGKLFVVATPIGNLEDITLRAIKTLKEVDIIACEDTRHSKKLLSHYGISKRLISYYKPKEHIKIQSIIKELIDGKNVALISDAGTPGISDPGEMLVKEARKNNIEVISIPGPSSIIAALSISGLKVIPFIFEGFIPKKKSDLIKRLKELEHLSCSIVYFVPPREIKDFLVTIQKIFGERRIFIGRELTKLFEEIRVGTPSELISLPINEKGEFVVIIEGKEIRDEPIRQNIEALIREAIESKKSFKDLLKSDKFKDIKRNELYKLYQELKNR